MNVSLTPELEVLVRKKVESGMYLSASEVVREALRLLDEQDRLRQVRLEELRNDIAVGLAQAESGVLIAGEVAFDRVRNKLRTKTRNEQG